MTTNGRSDANTKEGKKHFKVALRAGLNQSEMKGNFRQDSFFHSISCTREGVKEPAKHMKDAL